MPPRRLEKALACPIKSNSHKEKKGEKTKQKREEEEEEGGRQEMESPAASPARLAPPVWDEVVDLDEGESTGPDGEDEVRAQHIPLYLLPPLCSAFLRDSFCSHMFFFLLVVGLFRQTHATTSNLLSLFVVVRAVRADTREGRSVSTISNHIERERERGPRRRDAPACCSRRYRHTHTHSALTSHTPSFLLSSNATKK